MIRLTIYRVGSTVEIDLNEAIPEDLQNVVAGEVYTIEIPKEKELIKFRPYYRRTVGEMLNIYAEEEL